MNEYQAWYLQHFHGRGPEDCFLLGVACTKESIGWMKAWYKRLTLERIENA